MDSTLDNKVASPHSTLDNKVIIDYTYAKQGKCGQSYGDACAMTELLARVMLADSKNMVIHCPTEEIRDIIIGHMGSLFTYIVDNYEFIKGDNTTTIKLFPEKSLEATYLNLEDAYTAILDELYVDLQDALMMMNHKPVCLLEICAPTGEITLIIMKEVIKSTLLDDTEIALLGTIVNYDIKIADKK